MGNFSLSGLLYYRSTYFAYFVIWGCFGVSNIWWHHWLMMTSPCSSTSRAKWKEKTFFTFQPDWDLKRDGFVDIKVSHCRESMRPLRLHAPPSSSSLDALLTTCSVSSPGRSCEKWSDSGNKSILPQPKLIQNVFYTFFFFFLTVGK